MSPDEESYQQMSGHHQQDERAVHVTAYSSAFDDLPVLQQRLCFVLRRLPDDVWIDFIQDESFTIRVEDFRPGRGTRMFMPMPQGPEHVSRCVVLRKKLDYAPEDFALYVIAHELAHAFLRNGGWGAIQDKEEAADALAASWGYPKPAIRWF